MERGWKAGRGDVLRLPQESKGFSATWQLQFCSVAAPHRPRYKLKFLQSDIKTEHCKYKFHRGAVGGRDLEGGKWLVSKPTK